MRYIVIGVLMLVNAVVLGQSYTIKGKVTSEGNDGVPFANLYSKQQQKGTSTDENGDFKLEVAPGEISLRISAIGIEQQFVELNIKGDTSVIINVETAKEILEEVVISTTLSEISKSESPVPVEVYSAKHLNKVPVATLLEATQNINGVRPQLNCAICNTGDIHINGMEGPYTMVTLDGMPLVGGLSTVYGLQGIPSSLLERVEVVKGPASTLYGSEAVAGLINVITKSAASTPDLSFDISSTSWREIQGDIMVKYGKEKKTQGVLGIDYHNYSNPIDKNNDNFTDVTLKDRISVFNKIQFARKKGRVASLMTRYMYEDRWGGEMNWTPEFRGGDSIYGESIFTNRFEVVGMYQLPIKEKVMLSGSYSYHNQDSKYGTTDYIGNQQITYGQMVWFKNAGTRHKFTSGLTFRYNAYDDNTFATMEADQSKNAPDNWMLPGMFVQDNISFNDNLQLLLGMRGDYHQKHGPIYSPRMNWKWSPSRKTAFRLGYGNGFRVVNIFTEDHAALTGAREVVFDGEINPETSHNGNLNIERRINTKWSFITLDGSIFYTYFNNRITPNYDANDDQIVYANLNGYGVSSGATLNARLIFEFPLRISLGATLLDVYNMEANEAGDLEKTEQLFTEPYTGTWSVSYSFTKPRLSIDYTGSLYGPMKLPLLENDFRAEYSDVFSIQNIKITKEIGKRWELYGGVRNLLNFTPPAYSILRGHDPFDKLVDDPIDNPNNYSFDPTYIYSSFQGITYFLGVKYEFNKK